jgi:hypothetical protein
MQAFLGDDDRVAAAPPPSPSCSVCHSSDVRASHMHGVVDRVICVALPLIPYRCRECGVRFWVSDVSAFAIARSAIVILLFVAGAATAAHFA